MNYFETNQFLVNIIVGARKTGKTTFVLGNQQIKIPGLMREYWQKKYKRILTVDTDPTREDYQHIPLITLEQLPYWKSGNVRLCANDFDQLIEMLYKLPLKECFINFEDAKKYVPTNLNGTYWEKFLIDTKKNKIDCIFMYHSWGWLPNGLITMCDRVEVFKTNTGPFGYKQKLGGFFEDAVEAHKQVTASSNRFIHLTIDNQS